MAKATRAEALKLNYDEPQAPTAVSSSDWLGHDVFILPA
jgi:hypothetical protein